MSSVSVREASNVAVSRRVYVPLNIKFETFLDNIRNQFDKLDNYNTDSFCNKVSNFLTSKDNARKLLEAYQEGLNNSAVDKEDKGEGYVSFIGTSYGYNFNKLNRLGKAFVLIVSNVNRFVGLSERQIEFLKKAFEEATGEVLKDYTKGLTGRV